MHVLTHTHTKTLLELTSELSAVTGYKINIQLYFCMLAMDTEIKNTIPLAIAQKIEILRYEFNKTFIELVY